MVPYQSNFIFKEIKILEAYARMFMEFVKRKSMVSDTGRDRDFFVLFYISFKICFYLFVCFAWTCCFSSKIARKKSVPLSGD